MTKGNNSKSKTKSKKKGATRKTASKTSTTQKNDLRRATRRGDSLDSTVKNNIIGLILFAFGLFLIFSLQTTASGIIGEKIGEFLKGMFGFVAFLLPYLMIVYAILIFTKIASRITPRVVVSLVVLFFMINILNALRFVDSNSGFYSVQLVYRNGIDLKGGGVVGDYLATLLVKGIGVYGTYIGVILIIIICLLISLNSPLAKLLEVRKERNERLQALRQERIKEERRVRMQLDEERLRAALEREYVPRSEITKGGFFDTTPSREKSPPLNVGSDEEKEKIPLSFLKKSPKDIFKEKKSENNEDDIEAKVNNEKPISKFDEGQTKKQEKFLEGEEPVGEIKGPKETKKIGKTNKVAADGMEEMNLEMEQVKQFQNYKAPPLNLLAKSDIVRKEGLSDLAKERALLLERTLNSFGVETTILDVTEGPTITRYEVQPAVGVKVSSILRLQDDLALNLKAKGLRIVPHIPGKAAIGIEIENGTRELVTLGDILNTKAFQRNESDIAFAVGRDIEGKPVVEDLKKMPHLLIAGATGAGKSVCINVIISSLLYKSSPEEVRLVLIDPKMVELGNYNGIPHLLIPVVTDPKKAASALNWAVGEMTERYNKFAESGTKNITTYNEKMRKNNENDKVLPKIVIVIDELADLMMVASSVVESAICRLAQMARAAGMHLIVATQRPSVDVITGLIKANVPSRIAFAVSSQIDSRTIIDMTGAEKLVGNGDMLFKPADKDKPIRIQCPFVSEKEVNDIIHYIINNNKDEVEYEEEVIEKIENGDVGGAVDSRESQADELLEDAALVVISAGQASVSMLQRRFRIGYNRAARLIDELEELNVIGPSEGSKPRQVLINQMEWEEMKVPSEGEEE